MGRQIFGGAGVAIEEETVREFEDGLCGRLLCPGDHRFDEARGGWNAAVDRRPAAIVRCEGVADVVDALNFARDNELEIAVRGGGHDLAGNAVCDGGMVIDLSSMRGIHADPKGRRVSAEAGCTWGELDRATQPFGLATPGGVVSTTGIAGLTLGGGVGWLVRRRGLTCDNVLSIDLVTADGRRLTANDHENEELFWGLRGGGGNFGIVTSFTYELHDQGPVLGGMLLHSRSRAPELLRRHRDFMAGAPWELTSHAAFVASPDGDPLVAIVLCYSGDPEEGEKLLRPLREFGPPVEDNVSVLPYVEMQRLMDPWFPEGRHNYWKSMFLEKPTDQAIDVLTEEVSHGAPPSSNVTLEYYGGRAALFEGDTTAFPHRQAPCNLVIRARWMDPATSQQHLEWARSGWNAMQPFGTGGQFYSYLSDEGQAGVRAAFGPNHDRLVALKRRYDPANLFHMNQNIQP